MASVDLASWFVAEAAGAYGDQVLADASPGAAGPRAVGRELARLIFARTDADAGIPAPLAAVIDRPGSSPGKVPVLAAVMTATPVAPWGTRSCRCPVRRR